MYDIGIIGGGTAGLTAAIYGQRAGKQTIVFEKQAFGGQIASSTGVENYPGIKSISGAAYSMGLLEQAKDLGAEMVMEMVSAIGREGDGFVLSVGKETYRCATVIVASGVTHRHLGIQKEMKLVGAGVSYCATCDGAFFRGRKVAVIGGGNTALQDADFLANYCERVYLVHRRDEFRGEAKLVERLKKRENIEFVLDSVVQDICGENMVEGLSVINKKTGEERVLEVAGIFVAIGQIPQNDIFDNLIRLDGGGFVLASEDCLTSCPGVFVAGDCRTKAVRQLTTAAADGAVAALAACQYLSDQ